ncbi:MerR family transcriptional regulator [Kineosporia rhizophila]|uniref:helix-turn-helix domain-containing protein n=1 Tax=Kineosporia TaxID=49184 RepID=UPI000ACE2C36|nr:MULTISPECIES: MerR family transcriptional regulator [Kineosporia]MCE0535683.1 MerR family transcriptional regulator [Kineosporia rhizophila]GLY17671.1 hypothetical protein Kisp01_46850 [Kineosporia sp. NBRC 101677]
MSWSTREIAELTGVTLRTVRHYHEVGLLPEPQRGANGYKQYDSGHRARILRIKRLTELGFSLSRIAGMGECEQVPREAVTALHAELTENIQRLERAREDLQQILRDAPAGDGPAQEQEPCLAADQTAFCAK